MSTTLEKMQKSSSPSSCAPSDHAKLLPLSPWLALLLPRTFKFLLHGIFAPTRPKKLLCIVSYPALCSSHLRTAVILILTAPCQHRTMPLHRGPCVHLLSWLLVHLSLQSVFPIRRRDIRTVELYVFLPKRGTAVTPLFTTAVRHPTYSKHTSLNYVRERQMFMQLDMALLSRAFRQFLAFSCTYKQFAALKFQPNEVRLHSNGICATISCAIFHSPVRYRYRSTDPTNEKKDRLI